MPQTDIQAEAAAALRQVADHWENRVYARARNHDHQYLPDQEVKTAHCAVAALDLVIHQITPSQVAAMLQPDTDGGIAAIYRRLTDTGTGETHAIRDAAHRALMAEAGSWSPEDASHPQILDTNDLRFADPRHAPPGHPLVPGRRRPAGPPPDPTGPGNRINRHRNRE